MSTSTPSCCAVSPAEQPTSSTSCANWFVTYKPLLLIVSYIVFGCLLVQWPSIRESGNANWMLLMMHSMALWFIAFSFFKMLDLRAFANAYAGYDLIAKRWFAWGLVYPFVELGLGVAYLIDGHNFWVNVVTLVIMGISSIGVIWSVLQKRTIQCACLGTVFQLPMSTVTIIEDVGMAAMAAWMLWVM